MIDAFPCKCCGFTPEKIREVKNLEYVFAFECPCGWRSCWHADYDESAKSWNLYLGDIKKYQRDSYHD